MYTGVIAAWKEECISIVVMSLHKQQLDSTSNDSAWVCARVFLCTQIEASNYHVKHTTQCITC